jgi:polysaccharide chain length determinant protein (PEP-CTERM system associated)
MEEEGKPIKFYIDLALRQKWYIIIPLAISIVVSYGYYKSLPKIYKATTTILVLPQKIPESYVRSTITTSVSDQLNTISQEILSRTRLEKVIQTLNLYPELRQKVPMEEVVEAMKKSIEVNLQSQPYSDRAQNTFSISHEGKEPRTVMLVTNQLASLFIEEHLKAREQQAESTSIFLSKELSEVEKQLVRKEAEMKSFRERNMGKLPQQLDANLRILERLQQQLQTLATSIKSAEDRSLILQNQIEQLKKSATVQIPHPTPGGQTAIGEENLPQRTSDDPTVTQWNQLKRDLTAARAKYTESHPDVVDLKRKIANLEPAAKEILEKQKALIEARQKELKAQRERAARTNEPIVTTDPATDRLIAQYHEQHTGALLEAERLRGEEKKLKEEIVSYKKRIEDTPKLEQEFSLLNRDYDLLKTTYQSLKDKKIQSQMAENLEKKQQGEQFKILDPARYPEKPVKPDRDRILMMGAFIGLAAGLGLAWFRDTLDQSFHSEEELETDLGLPILATLPNMKEERTQPDQSHV